MCDAFVDFVEKKKDPDICERPIIDSGSLLRSEVIPVAIHGQPSLIGWLPPFVGAAVATATSFFFFDLLIDFPAGCSLLLCNCQKWGGSWPASITSL